MVSGRLVATDLFCVAIAPLLARCRAKLERHKLEFSTQPHEPIRIHASAQTKVATHVRMMSHMLMDNFKYIHKQVKHHEHVTKLVIVIFVRHR